MTTIHNIDSLTERCKGCGMKFKNKEILDEIAKAQRYIWDKENRITNDLVPCSGKTREDLKVNKCNMQ